MGTRKTHTAIKKIAKCSICRKVPTANCNWQQGRCPHRPDDVIITRLKQFINLAKKNNIRADAKAFAGRASECFGINGVAW